MDTDSLIKVLHSCRKTIDECANDGSATDLIIYKLENSHINLTNWWKFERRITQLFNETQETIYLDILMEMRKIWNTEVECNDEAN